jgi:quercetin dioxygenase-like cupin family protein
MNEVEVLKENDQDLRIYFNGPTDQLKSMVTGNMILMPGMSPHPPHRHPEEEFMWVTQGSGEILVEDKTYQVAAGSVMYCAGNYWHAITNTGTEPMIFYFSKWLAKTGLAEASLTEAGRP